MRIFIRFFLLLFWCVTVASSREPFLATLVDIQSNDIQRFQYGNYKFNCLPYGVVSLEQLHRDAQKDSNCRKKIENFYAKRRDLLYYTQHRLYLRQLYPIVRKGNSRCVLHISGEKSLSEFLLEEGLALLKPAFKDRKYDYYFQNAQSRARIQRNGLWSENIFKECAAFLHVKDDVE